MIHFPAICIDNFYSDPDGIRNWALSLDYKPAPEGQWPGLRSSPLHLVDPKFFQDFCHKIFSLYFDTENTDIKWVVHTQFQLIEPYDADPKSKKNTGWIHYDDDTIFGGLIYLNPEIDVDCGTSVFRQDKESISSADFKQAKQTFYRSKRFLNYDNILSEHNSNFTETIVYKNLYNRFISFDGETAHKANSFFTEIPRLTQVFFVNKCETTSLWPLARHQRYL